MKVNWQAQMAEGCGVSFPLESRRNKKSLSSSAQTTATVNPCRFFELESIEHKQGYANNFVGKTIKLSGHQMSKVMGIFYMKSTF